MAVSLFRAPPWQKAPHHALIFRDVHNMLHKQPLLPTLFPLGWELGSAEVCSPDSTPAATDILIYDPTKPPVPIQPSQIL